MLKACAYAINSQAVSAGNDQGAGAPQKKVKGTKLS